MKGSSVAPAGVQVAGHPSPAVDVLPDALELGSILRVGEHRMSQDTMDVMAGS